MITIGSGNTGCKLAIMFDEDALLFSTAYQDSNNFLGKTLVTISDKGASKKFTAGLKIWNKNYEKLESELEEIKNENVVVFAALGGGSGSSSLVPISEILIKNKNKVLVVGILPYKKEVNPPLANAVQSINSLMSIISDISVVIFDNHKLMKEYGGNWNKINSYIVKRVDYMVNLLEKYNEEKCYSPLTLDESELESVVFGGGFIDISETFLEKYTEKNERKYRTPKFTYGGLDKTTKNCLTVMFVSKGIEDSKIEEYHNIFTGAVQRLSTSSSNARMIPGILRAEINHSNSEDKEIKDRAYLTIASGLNIDRYLKQIEKLRDTAIEKAEIFSQKIKGTSVVKGKAKRLLDI
jgi:cell division GTPase FtsZ